MKHASEEIDSLTKTFSADRAYADALLASPYAQLVAELLLTHNWANVAMPVCHKALSAAVSRRFHASQKERAVLWNFILCDSLHRDLRLLPYFILRGLASEASGALRRAFEHVRVLTHIWADPEKLDILEDPGSKRYAQAFRCEIDKAKAVALRVASTSKRFAAMRFGVAASKYYDLLSEFDIHGGTNHRFFAYSTESSAFTCSFCMRPKPAAKPMRKKIELLGDGHRAVYAEVIGLCADHAVGSEDLSVAAERFRILASVTGEPTPALQSLIEHLLRRLRGNSLLYAEKN